MGVRPQRKLGEQRTTTCGESSVKTSGSWLIRLSSSIGPRPVDSAGPGSRGVHGLMGGFLRSNSLRTLHTSRPNVPGPGAAQPPASVRPRPRAPHALAATTTSDAPREAPTAERFGGWVHRHMHARTCYLYLAVASAPWVSTGPVPKVTAKFDHFLGLLERFFTPYLHTY